MSFKRERRYFVVKLSDIAKVEHFGAKLLNRLDDICGKVESYREQAGKSPLECVVVEKDWPEYEIVWQMLKDRMEGNISVKTNCELLAESCRLLAKDNLNKQKQISSLRASAAEKEEEIERLNCELVSARSACKDKDAALAEKDARIAEVTFMWSKKPPTKPGWYWSKDHHGVARVVQVHAHPELPEVMTLLENSWCGWQHVRIHNKGREWAGPVPMPTAGNILSTPHRGKRAHRESGVGRGGGDS